MAYVEIGGIPTSEECAATGKTDDAVRFNRIECRAYIKALEKVYGARPEGTAYRLRANSHDFGTYYEVAFHYDHQVAEQSEYANKVESGLDTWAQAGFWIPVIYDDKGQAVRVIEDLDRLDIEANPDALTNGTYALAHGCQSEAAN